MSQKPVALLLLLGIFSVESIIAQAHKSSLGYDVPIFEAARLADFQQIKKLVENGALVNNKDTDGRSPLMVVVRTGNILIPERIKIAKYLIENGADVNAISNDNSTALHAAANAGTLDIIKLLVEKGANVNTEDIYGFKPTYYARGQHKLDIVKYLIEAAKVQKPAPVPTSEIDQLSRAVRNNDLELVQKLVAEKKGLVLNRDSQGMLPIEWAGNKPEIAKFLKEQGSEVPDTLLFYAFGSGSLPVAKWLIEEVKIEPRIQREKLIDVARRNGQEHMIQYLGEFGLKI
ncbi:MAG: hypothetical protein UV38_C0002G0193 [candidate division TM6 bacterium GW2011_GWE2_42_60]|nr:MAG: hypothetical protein UV38_C0002G0193 [candidate division TM6 bacterium GW2011_GWE2_42_60]HBY06052.1 hypothetical protein [Candidatus Dependentiae bacterium]